MAETYDRGELLAAVEAQWPYIQELLEELVAAPTTLGNEHSGQEVMRRALTHLDLDPVAIPLDPDALHEHDGGAPFSWSVEGKENLVGTWKPAAIQGGRSLILGGHIDVVGAHPADMWASDPFTPRVDGEWMYGRGAGDMKAGLVAMVGAVKGLQSLGLRPLAPVQLQSVVEEECTGNGALQCVISGERADAAVITEPTGLQLQTSQVGVLWFQVVVRGRPAHAGDAPIGANSIEASYKVIAELRELEQRLNQNIPELYQSFPHPINLNIGVIEGGDWASTVAAETLISCRLALFPGHDPAELQEQVEATVAAVDLDGSGFTAEVRYDGFRCEGFTLDDGAAVIDVLRAAQHAVTGEEPVTYASTATTDARSYMLYADTPALCFGPYAENIHGIDERVHLPSVLHTAQALAVFIADWCGVAVSAE